MKTKHKQKHRVMVKTISRPEITNNILSPQKNCRYQQIQIILRKTEKKTMKDASFIVSTVSKRVAQNY